jgi:hypothetical protein
MRIQHALWSTVSADFVERWWLLDLVAIRGSDYVAVLQGPSGAWGLAHLDVRDWVYGSKGSVPGWVAREWARTMRCIIMGQGKVFGEVRR